MEGWREGERIIIAFETGYFREGEQSTPGGTHLILTHIMSLKDNILKVESGYGALKNHGINGGGVFYF